MAESVEERLDRIESTLAIQQLVARYALAVDSRDVDAWIGLFVEDVDCGQYGKGREALRSFIDPGIRAFYRSVHFVGGHTIDFDGKDRATGTVYCRAEHEDGDRWVAMQLTYFDSYERRDGQWYFVKRSERAWYAADQLERPQDVDFHGWTKHPLPMKLPRAFPTWEAFWRRSEPDEIAAITRLPTGD
jgi:hypothetical protein